LADLAQRLISVGRQAFFRDGYGATTMDKVAAAARVSKSTLYSRFPSKEALFRAVVQDQIESWNSGANHTPVIPSEGLEDALRQYGNVWLRAGISANFLNMTRLIFGESERFPELGASSKASSRLGIDSIATVIRQFAERDGVPCRDPEAAAELFQIMIAGWIHQSVLTNTLPELEAGKAWVAHATRVFVTGRDAW
jgi:AcrR family transcriptional regulator